MTYLAFALVLMAIGISIIVMRNRPSTSMESSIDDFQRGLRALAPEAEGERPAPSAAAPVPAAPTERVVPTAERDTAPAEAIPVQIDEGD